MPAQNNYIEATFNFLVKVTNNFVYDLSGQFILILVRDPSVRLQFATTNAVAMRSLRSRDVKIE